MELVAESSRVKCITKVSLDLSSQPNEYLYKMAIQQLLRYFSLEESCGPVGISIPIAKNSIY